MTVSRLHQAATKSEYSTHQRLPHDQRRCHYQWRSSSSAGVGTVPGIRRCRDARRPRRPPWRQAMRDTCRAVAPLALGYAHRLRGLPERPRRWT